VVKLVDTSRFSIGMARMVVRVEFLKRELFLSFRK
jgi:hypothetical protein